MTFLHPCDPRWQGPARRYMYFDLFKNIMLIAFIVLVIVEGALHRHWYREYHSTVGFNSGGTATTIFFRIGLVLLPDILSVLLTHTLLPKQHFHPIFALTQALALFCLYPSIFTSNLIIVYSDETGHPYIDTWQRLCWSEMGMQAVLMVLWTALVICACIAVHRWRGVKAKEVSRGVVREEMEMQAGKGEWRKDSANIEEGRNALVCGSVKSDRVFSLRVFDDWMMDHG